MPTVKSLATWMAERNVSLEDLLSATGLERKVLTAIMAGQFTASPQQRERVAKALGIPKEEIAWQHTVPVVHCYGHGPQFGRTP